MNIIKALSEELSIKESQVEAVLSLLDQGDTVPFIARYRKEVTGGVDDATLRNLEVRLAYLKGLEERRNSILSSIKEQGKLTAELEEAINAAKKLTELENLYRPYKKKKKTRGSMAKEKGLTPLADYLLKQHGDLASLSSYASSFINAEKGVSSIEEALQGAMDIIAEKASDEAKYYEFAKSYIERTGKLLSKQTKNDVENTYLTYKAFSMPVRQVRNYQVLALSRGENEKKLQVSFSYDELTIVNSISRDYLLPSSPFEEILRKTFLDSYKRLIAPAVETEIRSEMFLKAEDASIELFKINLRQLLLAAPLKGKRIMGFDPAFVNGCKLAALDESGKLLDVAVIYPTIGGDRKIIESQNILLSLIKKDRVDVIALGNGTASRESELFLLKCFKDNGLSLPIVIVNESGASVYSASKLAEEEFPGLSVEKRSAASLARRLLDPLSELVKIDPCAIGVGQYQHDMDKKKLSLALAGVVENCVNEVGVYLNAASPSLLSYVAGIGPSLAQSIVSYRDEHGPFKERKDLLNVPKLGAKAYKQAAGFLRISGGYPLDNTGVHPESYKAAIGLLKQLGLSLNDLGGEKAKNILTSPLDFPSISQTLGIGEATLKDIVIELSKPGRDPRDEIKQATLSMEAMDIKDLKPGMILSGTVRNVMDFGAFVDIGVHQDGLVHISELSDHFIKSPFDVIHIGDIVKVKVLSVDLNRKRIGLSMKGLKED